MTEEIWKLVDYDCQDGKCLMIWNIDKDVNNFATWL